MDWEGLTSDGGFGGEGDEEGEEKNIAIFSSPDGRSVRYSEDTIINPNLMILDIFDDHIYFKSNEQEYTIDLNNNKTKSEG